MKKKRILMNGNHNKILERVRARGSHVAGGTKFCQLEVRSDLSNYCSLPGSYSFVFSQRLGSAHAHTSYDRASRAYTKYFRF